ncbi:PVC-type heme-binding CxxCH protein [Schlesneria sp. T3-172]|uniref:PVC-type heme-binding CxxCH protein n=1 Tax=Schlesneria sphaerica TaxID=3373610 RepID=UPI0037CB230B
MNWLRWSCRGWIFALSVSCCSTGFAQRELTDIPIPDAEEERKTFVLPEGFEVNLFAADPAIHKPIQMNFDPQGRLWIAASEVYPQIAPGQPATDKILVLEDTDGDGVSDKTTVFADGLLIPTGVEPGDGGAYVANSTELLHLTDTDGDGKADQSRIVLSGFGTEDTHHILHTFRWGMDGQLYMNQSIYIHSHVETPFGVRRLNAGGIWRFRPETMRLDVFARGWVNTWGHAFDRWGQSFVTDGAGGEGINYAVPGAAYPTVYGVNRILHGLNPGSPKYCGLEMVDGRHLPDDWQGNLITHDFRGHRVCRFVLSEDGAGFAARQQPDLISSEHVAFRPIDVKQGPDGAIYIADWYNPIIQHGEVDFRDPRRDHTHGRIWRVTAKGRKLVDRPQFAGKSAATLLDSLKSPESYERHHAKRVLKEQGEEKVVPALAAWVKKLDSKDPNFEHHRLEALWMYQSLDVPEPALLKAVLDSKTPQARAAAVRVVPQWKEHLPAALDWLEVAIQDEHPRVQMETVRALSEFPELRAAAIALRAADRFQDQFGDYALWQTSRELAPVWLPEVVSGKFDFEGSVARLLFAIRSAEAGSAIPVLVQKLREGKVPAELTNSLMETLGQLGGAEDLRLVFDLALTKSTPAAQSATMLTTLAEAKRKRDIQPAGDLAPVIEALKSKDGTLQTAAVDCIGAWRLESLRAPVTAIVTDSQSETGVRLAAIRGVSQLGGDASKQLLGKLASTDKSETIRAAAITSLIQIDTPAAAALAVKLLEQSEDVSAQSAIINAFLQHKGGPDVLAAAFADQKLSEDVAKIALRIITGSGRQEPKLTEAISKAGNIVNAAKVLSKEEMAALVATIRESGNAARGEQIFRRAELNCLKCHAVGGAGGKVGPDLVSVGSSAQIDYLVDSILDPNKNVKEGYQSLVVATDEGKVFTGIKVRETDTDLLLRDVEDREFAVPLKSIDDQQSGSSLMPVGLVDKLTRAELIDLVRFMSELGKPGPYAAVTARVVRRWETLQPTKESYTRLSRTSDAQVVADDAGLNWVPVYSTVSGALPLSDVMDFTMRGLGDRKFGFARCTVNVTTAGVVGFLVNDTTGLEVWVDGKPVDPAMQLSVPLDVGTHQVTFGVNLLTRTKPLRVELNDVKDSKAQAQFVGGK